MNNCRPALLCTLAVLGACSSSSNGVSNTTVRSPTTATTTVTTTAAGPTVPAGPIQVSDNTPLAPGRQYQVPRTVLQRDIHFTATDSTRQAYSASGFLAVTADKNGAQPLLVIIDLATAHVFRDPHADFSTFDTKDDVLAATNPVPDDFLGYLAQLPGLTAGAVATTQFLGVPARAMTYKVTSTKGGFPCAVGRTQACLLALFVTSGPTIGYFEGDSGTYYELQVDGRRLVAQVTDRPGAADLVAGFVLGE